MFDAEFNIDTIIDKLPLERLCFVGIITLIDPPRPEVPEVIVYVSIIANNYIVGVTDLPYLVNAKKQACVWWWLQETILRQLRPLHDGLI